METKPWPMKRPSHSSTRRCRILTGALNSPCASACLRCSVAQRVALREASAEVAAEPNAAASRATVPVPPQRSNK